jgi:quercetin dioxygenase-like cupin family protein
MADEWKARPDRPVEVPFQHARLAEQVERLKEEPTWRERGRNAITLTKEPGLRLVLMVLGQGTTISEHQAAGPLTLHVLNGSVIFRTGGRAPTVAAGDLIVLEAAIDHEVYAVEESVVLLTLAGASASEKEH